VLPAAQAAGSEQQRRVAAPDHDRSGPSTAGAPDQADRAALRSQSSQTQHTRPGPGAAELSAPQRRCCGCPAWWARSGSPAAPRQPRSSRARGAAELLHATRTGADAGSQARGEREDGDVASSTLLNPPLPSFRRPQPPTPHAEPGRDAAQLGTRARQGPRTRAGGRWWPSSRHHRHLAAAQQPHRPAQPKETGSGPSAVTCHQPPRRKSRLPLPPPWVLGARETPPVTPKDPLRAPNTGVPGCPLGGTESKPPLGATGDPSRGGSRAAPGAVQTPTTRAALRSWGAPQASTRPQEVPLPGAGRRGSRQPKPPQPFHGAAAQAPAGGNRTGPMGTVSVTDPGVTSCRTGPLHLRDGTNSPSAGAEPNPAGGPSTQD